MRKYFVLLLVLMLCSQHLVYGQRGYDSLPGTTTHIKFGDPIRFNAIEGAELYEFIFSKVLVFDTIQTLDSYICDTIQSSSPYIGVSDYKGVLQLFEPYNVVMRYYTNGEWSLSAEKAKVTLYTDSGTHHMIHNMVKAGHMPKTLSMMSPQTRSIPDDMLIEIPVVYHVVVPSCFDGDPREYISPADIYQNINILNNVFSGQTGEFAIDTKIRFRLATTDPIEYCGQNYYGITYNTYSGENNINLNNTNLESPISYPIDFAYRGTYHAIEEENIHLSEYYNLYPSNQYVNIWIFDRIEYEHESVYGLTSSPSLSNDAYPILTIIKDVVRENENCLSRELGYTVAHEMGHLFGLLHAWIELIEVGYSTPHGVEWVTYSIVDGIDDTIDEMGPVLNCDYSNLDHIPYDNIMSYTPDGCRYRFTPLQIEHMRNMIANFFPYEPINETEYHVPSMMGVRFEDPEENWFCSSNSFDIRIHAQPTERNYIRRFEIEGVEDFNPTFTFEDNDNTRIYHIQLSQPLPEGYYNFIIHCGVEDDCTSISKQYYIVECNNNNIDMSNAQWYFDTKVTLDFRNGIAQLGEFSAMVAYESESGICDDVQGEILFYTDGNNIWNSNHELIDEGEEEIVNRGTIVLRLNETKYAVVSLKNDGQLASRLIELDPETHATNITPMPPYQETLYAGITAVPCPTGGYWLISTKQYENGLDIVSLKITLNGNSIVYERGSHEYLYSHRFVDRKAVVMKASPEGKYIACALAEIGLHIFYFNATYGTFSSIDIENCQGEIGGKRPSLAFSPSGRFLYMSDLLKIRQYDMDGDYSCNCTELHSSIVYEREPISGENTMRVDLNLQEGPDGRIYFSRSSDIFSNSRKIGVIMEPDNLVLYNNGETICNINDSIIEYPLNTILQNRENLPNIVDVKDIDTCVASFTICSENCNVETLVIHNFSLSPTITWTFMDLEENVLFTIDDEIEPVLSNYVDRFNNLDAFIIEQSTGCEGSIKRDTVSFNPQLSILGQDMICLDGRPYTYSVSMEPYSHISSTQWVLNGFNGSADYGNGASNLIITPNVNDHEFTITCNVQGQFCKDTATLEVHADTICSFITEFIQKCHHGQIILTNALSDDLSDYEANIIIGQHSYPMSLSQDHNSFVFLYKDSSNPDVQDAITLEGIELEDLNATIVVSNRFAHEVVSEFEVIIPRIRVGVDVLGIIAPALCDNDVCYISIAVSGGQFESSYQDYPITYVGESSNGDLIYHVPVDVTATLDGDIIINDAVCEEIRKFQLPYTSNLGTEITAYQTDICTDVGYSTIIIKVELPIELPSIPNDQMPPQHIPYPTHESLSVSWNDGYETPLVLSQGSTYIACRYIFEPGIYTPTVHYTSLCSETLEPINIQDLSSTIPVPIIHDIPSAYVCNSTETTSINIEMEIYEVDEDYVPYAICNGHIYTTERLPETDTYTIIINGLMAGDHIATLYYTSSCSIDIPFAIQLVEPEIRAISHTNVCRYGDLATITIEMGLSYTEDGFPIVEWNDGEITDFELIPGSNTIYVAARNDLGVGTYTATIHYTSDCAITLDPITISFVQEPIINVIPPTPTYLCDINETTSITIEFELDYLEDGFVPRAVWNDGETTYFELLPGTNTTYRTSHNNIGAGTYIADVYYTSRCYTKSEAIIIQVFEQPVISNISHTNICYDGDLASITVEMELNYTEDGFPIVVWNDGATTNFELLPGSNTTYTATRSNIVSGLYTAEVQYSSYCLMPLGDPIPIAVSDINVNYNYISENEVGINLNFDPPLSSYTISVTENGITTETTTSQNPYYFVTNINNDVEITTSCGTIPLSFRVTDVAMDLKSEACLESDADISFEISGGAAPYTATFTNGDYTNTMTINNAGSVVMNVEIMQGEANHLTIVSANGDTYDIDLGTINNISNYAILENPNLDSYTGGTFVVPSSLTFDHNVTFTNCTIYCAYTDYDDIASTQWTVNAGKTVTFENCTIKSGCPDKMWQGIEVIGETFTVIDPPFPPIPINPTDEQTRAIGEFGKVVCHNSTIEDAIKAIESTDGGKIIASGSHFNNNQFGLYYNEYAIAQGSKTSPTITNCTFSTTRRLNNSRIYPNAHIMMKKVRGIYIRGCSFENTLPYLSLTIQGSANTGYNRGSGIKATASHFDVSSSCSFNKLFHGVHASGFKSKAVVVENSSFTGNHRAIYINSNDGCKVLNNNIVSRGEPSEPYVISSAAREDREVDYSVFIGSCHTFTFEQNSISNATTGLYVYNSGRQGNQVRYNTFEGRPDERTFQLGLPIATKPQYNAIVVVGENSSYRSDGLGSKGLEVLCNTFRRNTRDIFIKDGYMRQQQGSNRAPTGNSFLFADLTGSHKQFLTQFSNTSMSNQYDVYTKYEYYQHRPSSSDNEYKHQLIAGYYNTNKITTHDYNSDYSPRYCQCSDGTGPVVDPYPFNPVPFPGVDRTKSHIQQLGTTLDSAVNEYETKLDGGNTTNALTKISTISTDIAPSINDLPQDGYLSDTVCNALVAKVEENPVYVTSVFVENSPLPTATYEDVQDAEISNILKTVLSYYQSGENTRVADEKAIGNIKQEISLNENLLYDKALNDSLTATDYNIILGYFTEKTDIDSKIMACNILTSSENYDEARQQISSIRSLGTTEAINCADVMDLYINTMDTTMTKEMLKAHQSQLENLIADDNYLYSGIATTLYEYAFDTIIPEYTPIYEEEFTAKSTKTKTASEIYPYAIYPNPTSDFINIELASNVLDDDIIEFLKHYGIYNIEDCETIQINIFDVNSRLVNTGKYKYDTLISIDVKNYPSGTYLVEIKGCYDNVMQTKIVKL